MIRKQTDIDENEINFKSRNYLFPDKYIYAAKKELNLPISRGAFKDVENRNAYEKIQHLKSKNGKDKKQEVPSNNIIQEFKPPPSPGPDITKDMDLLHLEPCDIDDPFQYTEYLIDVYRYLRSKESMAVVAENFVTRQVEINDKMRSILVDWIVQVHGRFNLSQETLFICVQLIDRFIEKQQIQRKELQLIGITCLLIASKYEEQCVPQMRDYVHVTDNSCKGSQIRNMECLILNVLNFDISIPIPLSFLRRYTKACHVNQKTHNMAKYFMEVCLTDSWVSTFCPSIIAASSLSLSMLVIGDSSWDSKFESVSGYSNKDLRVLMQRISYLVGRNEEIKLMAVTLKYANKAQGCVSSLELLKSSEFRNFHIV